MNEDPFIQHLIGKYQNPAFVDEVGLGSIFGELVACAVLIPQSFRMDGVNDSKQLKQKEILRLSPLLKQKVQYSLGIITTEELKEIGNMCKADQLAFLRAVQGLTTKPDAVFVDGRFAIQGFGEDVYPVIKGDAKVFGIAVASIIAKDSRDRMVVEKYGEKFARYHIASNKGYRSPDHLMAIRKFGLTPFHRPWMPQIHQVLSGKYDQVIMSKYRNRWEKLKGGKL